MTKGSDELSYFILFYLRTTGKSNLNFNSTLVLANFFSSVQGLTFVVTNKMTIMNKGNRNTTNKVQRKQSRPYSEFNVIFRFLRWENNIIYSLLRRILI